MVPSKVVTTTSSAVPEVPTLSYGPSCPSNSRVFVGTYEGVYVCKCVYVSVARVYMSVRVCVSMYTCVYMRVCVYMYVVCIHLWTCVHVNVYMCVCTCVSVL